MDAAALQTVSLCRGLDRRAAEQLLSVARPVSFLAGAELVCQGEPARGAFLVRSGEVEARIALPGGGSLAVAQLGDGAVFGEMSLIEHGVCTATVAATRNVDGWFIEREDFRALVACRDPVALALQRALADALVEKLGQLNERVRGHPAQHDAAAADDAPAGDPLAGVPRSRRASFDWRAFLPVLPFFAGFDAFEIDETVAGARVIELPRGAWLFCAGASAAACFLVVRGAVEVFTRANGRQRRVAIAGPGELVGYLGLLRGTAHASNARVRESACLLEFPRDAFLSLYGGGSGASVSLLHALHRSLLRALARTNTQLTGLISHARLHATAAERAALEAALHAQICRPE